MIQPSNQPTTNWYIGITNSPTMEGISTLIQRPTNQFHSSSASWGNSWYPVIPSTCNRKSQGEPYTWYHCRRQRKFQEKHGSINRRYQNNSGSKKRDLALKNHSDFFLWGFCKRPGGIVFFLRHFKQGGRLCWNVVECWGCFTQDYQPVTSL